jgi:hypothetical protein
MTTKPTTPTTSAKATTPSKAVATITKTTTPKPAPAKKVTAPAKKVTPPAEVATAVTVNLSGRVDAARALGFSRKFLMEESGLTGTTALWRTDRLSEAHAALLGALLVKIEDGTVAPPVRRVAAARGSSRQHRLTQALLVLAQAKDEKTAAGKQGRIDTALELLKTPTKKGGTSE